ncbi:hypothetical protein SASPL_133057 [Salvia splendens]|uniref:Pectinesterase catalytic domain-containing protein n=1 Tax=Salvia splendens TaxID=180675 RepID=A0A8X8ZHQ4_SALSN|nr:hypothetical protein SASPL_133057 [Salvia splendens]
MQPDAVVAADGSGNYLTINEAINTAPSRTVQGFGFIAMDMGFENTTGPEKDQVVALFSASDRSVFYRYMVDGYQDTLFARSHRQFYREHIHTQLFVLAAENLDGVETFLGRPWHNYSTVVIMESQLGIFIDLGGWRAWGGSDPRLGVPDTILYVEYNIAGLGAVTIKRVHWKGLKVENSLEYARSYTVGSFLGGDDWLPSTGVTMWIVGVVWSCHVARLGTGLGSGMDGGVVHPMTLDCIGRGKATQNTPVLPMLEQLLNQVRHGNHVHPSTRNHELERQRHMPSVVVVGDILVAVVGDSLLCRLLKQEACRLVVPTTPVAKT